MSSSRPHWFSYSRDEAPVSKPAAAPLSLAAQRAQIRKLQRKLVRAFRRRYRKDPSQLGAVLEAMKGSSRGAILSATTQLFALCQKDGNLAWLASLPHGEEAAVAELDRLITAFAKRVKTGDQGVERSATEERNRAWTVASVLFERIREAGRYLVESDPSRKGDYRAFESVRVMKARGKNKSKKAAPAPVTTDRNDG